MQFYKTKDLAAFQNELLTAMLPDKVSGRCPIPGFSFNDIPCNYRLTKRRQDCIKNDREAVLNELDINF